MKTENSDLSVKVKRLLPNFQAKVLALLLVDRGYAAHLIRLNKEIELFDPKYEKIWKLIILYFQKYKRIPTFSVLQQICEIKFKEEQQAAVQVVLDEISGFRDEESEFVKEHTDSFIKNAIMTKALLRSYQDLTEGNIDNIYTQVKEAINLFEYRDDMGHSYVEDYQKRFDGSAEVRENPIPTGLDLDNYLSFGIKSSVDKGLCTGEVGVIIAGPGRGKSTLLLNMAYHAVLKNKNVLFITLELNEKTVGRRLDIKNLGDKQGDMENEAVAQYFRNVRQNISSNLLIKFFPARKTGLLEIEAYIDQLKITRGFEPDLVIIDYLGLLKPSRYHPKQQYLELEELIMEMRGIGAERRFAVWTAHQTHRGARNKERVDAEDIAGSYAITYPSDLVCSLSGTPQEISRNIMRLNIIKNRVGTSEVTLPIRVNLARCMMVDGDPADLDGSGESGMDYLDED